MEVRKDSFMWTRYTDFISYSCEFKFSKLTFPGNAVLTQKIEIPSMSALCFKTFAVTCYSVAVVESTAKENMA